MQEGPVSVSGSSSFPDLEYIRGCGLTASQVFAAQLLWSVRGFVGMVAACSTRAFQDWSLEEVVLAARGGSSR